MTNLRIDLRWGAWPGSASVVPPLREIGQRERDLLWRARSNRVVSGRSSGGDAGGVVAGVGDKVIVTHSVFFVLCVVQE